MHGLGGRGLVWCLCGWGRGDCVSAGGPWGCGSARSSVDCACSPAPGALGSLTVPLFISFSIFIYFFSYLFVSCIYLVIFYFYLFIFCIYLYIIYYILYILYYILYIIYNYLLYTIYYILYII